MHILTETVLSADVKTARSLIAKVEEAFDRWSSFGNPAGAQDMIALAQTHILLAILEKLEGLSKDS